MLTDIRHMCWRVFIGASTALYAWVLVVVVVFTFARVDPVWSIATLNFLRLFERDVDLILPSLQSSIQYARSIRLLWLLYLVATRANGSTWLDQCTYLADMGCGSC